MQGNPPAVQLTEVTKRYRRGLREVVALSGLSITVPRGECCVYVFHLTVYDRTARPCGVSYATADWPVKICNDLPPS